MASWNEILDRFGHMPSQYDLVRREYLKQLSNLQVEIQYSIILHGCKSL